MKGLALIMEDVRAVRRRDPAAPAVLDVLLFYPGLQAVWAHRLAHSMWRRRVPLLPHLLASLMRFFTGVEIHPGAEVGRRVFIDHGAGVVIGETAVIGDDVTIFHGVTLGGTGKATGGKRHPTIGSGVLIGAGAQVLGAIEVGDGARIGAGAVVLKDVPPHVTVAGVPARVVVRRSPGEAPLHLHDPQADALRRLEHRVASLEAQLGRAEAESRPAAAALRAP